jgi:putative oxidoreductase
MNHMSEWRVAQWGMVPLRIVIGLAFLMHGGMKLFSFGIGGTAGFLGKMGVPIPGVSAVVLIVVELLGGLAILIGFYARWAAAALAFDMLVAILVAKLHGGYFAPNGFELELDLLGACLTILVAGSGGMSVQNPTALREPKA